MSVDLSQLTEYDDDHMSCARTWATLRVYSAEIGPGTVTETLCALPSETIHAGERAGHRGRRRELNSWLLESRAAVSSRDLRRHLDWLLDSIDESGLIRLLQDSDAEADIFCFWESKGGQGGPIVSPLQMSRMSRLGLHLVLDIYGAE